jgi:hypothetical protein
MGSRLDSSCDACRLIDGVTEHHSDAGATCTRAVLTGLLRENAKHRIPPVEERFDRQARNEKLMRSVNERIAAIDERAVGWSDPGQLFDFQCECGKISGCNERVLMTLTEYDRVRVQRDRFAVVPGHETDEIEYVVERDARFVIVDKRGDFEQLVE